MSAKLGLSLAGLDLDLSALEKLGPAERKAAEGELLLLEEAFRRNPLLGYRPHAKQVEFSAPPFDPLRAFFGGNRSGKTTAVVIDSVLQAVDREFVPDHLLGFKRWEPPFFCRFVTPDLTNTLEGVVLQKLRDWCPREQLRGGSFDRAWDKVLRILRFKNGSWFQFFSNDQDRDKFGGAALHRVVYDEEPRQDIRQECLMRLIDFGGEEMFALTPFSGMGWLYDEVYEPWEEGHLEDGRVVVVDMDDNPHLDEVTKKRVLAGLSSEERDARKSGRFVHFAGLIYPEFSWGKHSLPELVVPEDPDRSAVPVGVEVFAGIDPGLRHPAVVLAYLDFEDRLIVFDEIMLPGRTVGEVCKELRKRELKWRVRPRFYVIDPAARNKNQQTGRSDQQEFSDHGIHAFPGQNDVRPGINRVKERLLADRLLVTANCQELRGEFKKYRWATPQARSENDPREKPVKKDDHLLDCLIAGTLISTLRGEVPIEDVLVGDWVWTREGVRQVTDWWRSPKPSEVVRVQTSDGELVGTGKHRVFIRGRGFVPLDSVRYGDTMVLWRTSMSLRGAESTFGAIRTPIVALTAFTSHLTRGIAEMVSAGYTKRFGRLKTGAFLPAGTFITPTGTLSTTPSTTSSAFLPRGTSIFTWTASDVPVRASTQQRFARWLPRGIHRRKAGRGTPSTPAKSQPLALQYPPSANTAVVTTSPWFLSASAPTTAGLRQGVRRGLMTRIVSAWRVARHSGSIATPRSRRVRVSAAPRPAGTALVYDLTVDGAHEFFANGLLVHNCLRYMVMARPLAPSEALRERTLTQKDRWLRKGLERMRLPRTPPSDSGPGMWA